MQAMDSSLSVIEDTYVQYVLLGEDRVLVKAAGVAVGFDQLQKLISLFEAQGEFLKAATAMWTVAIAFENTATTRDFGGVSYSQKALALIAEHALATEKAQQLELEPPRHTIAMCILATELHLCGEARGAWHETFGTGARAVVHRRGARRLTSSTCASSTWPTYASFSLPRSSRLCGPALGAKHIRWRCDAFAR